VISEFLRCLKKLMRRVKSRPETWIADKRLAFSIQTPSIESPYTPQKQKQVEIPTSRNAQGFLGTFHSQHEALTV
jgi:hypothetical protein